MVGARVRRQQVAFAQGRGLSARRACALLSVARSTLGYVSRLIARDAPVLPAVRTLAGQYPRYGYRTIRIFLEREGHVLGTDRMYRLWRQEGLQVPKKRPRRRVATGRPRPLAPTAVNHVWAYDFLRWLQATQIETAFIDPGKPWQNGVDESFNGTFRDQHLSLQWFRHRAEAKVSIEQWRRHYNDVRPHSSLGYLRPNEFRAKQVTTTTQIAAAVL